MHIHPTISANTLFHFTDSIDNHYNVIGDAQLPNQETYEWAVPMVCFCDLPLSQIGAHLSVYGDYGIGMTKTWGRKNGIAPIVYVYRESILTAKLSEILRRVRLEENHQERNKLSNMLYDFTCFLKPYEGNLWREGGELVNIRFYDEREWRFVAFLPDDFYRRGLPKSEFLDSEIRSTANQRLSDISRISFDPNDIKYLIVRREEEIVRFIREVEHIKGRYGHNDVKLLASRVISAEQIRVDF
jgi:hypothetical protein